MIAQQLKKIGIEGFRSIEKTDIPLDRINLLIGSNGSGKSNVLGIFELLHAITLGKLQKYVEDNGGGKKYSFVMVPVEHRKFGSWQSSATASMKLYLRRTS